MLAVFATLPKQHLAAIGIISFLLGLLLFVSPANNAIARSEESIAIPPTSNELPTSTLALLEPLKKDAQEEPINPELVAAATKGDRQVSLPAQEEPSPTYEYVDWKKVKVRAGDNLSTIFQREGLSAREVYIISKAADKHNDSGLKKIFPGQELNILTDDSGALSKLQYVKNPLESIVYRRTENGYEIDHIIREPQVTTQFVSAYLKSSMFMAGKEAGLSQQMIMELANIFGGVIDFIYDPRKGDTFSILFEEKHLDGELIGYGNILAASYTNRGERHNALYYVDQSGKYGHYSPEGISMRKAFLRAPVDFTRISSNFSLARKHPIHKNFRAHRGIDYAAPRGTPIVAAGEGRVVASSYSRANGNYVFIRHGEQYETKYLHLSKRAVKTGQRVRQGQVIGNVGATGYATGPHLHYEFLLNGVHRNPRTILDKLPKAKSLDKDELPHFLAATSTLLATIESQARVLALNEK